MSIKITSVADLNAVRDARRKELADFSGKTLLLCAGGGCIASGAFKVETALKDALAKAGMTDVHVRLVHTGCMGPCVSGPLIQIDDIFYEHVAPEDAADIVSMHLQKGQLVERLLRKDAEGRPIPRKDDIPFFAKQTKLALHNCGKIDPQLIEDYIAADGYQGLAKALGSLGADGVIEEMKASGLRGRGGAGFPAWMKWSFARKSEGDMKYALCNADEGDPGAFMDRSVLEGDPHSVIEGMAIAACAIGAPEGFVYVRAEYPLAVERLRMAIGQAREAGLLGGNILGSGFSFDLEIRMGSGAFVCGEETALITSIEGKRGEPRPRPPFPAVKGLWGKPTILNNVETYANVPSIILNGGAWYAQYGTEKSKGTKVFALAGNIVNAGLVEVPIGMPLGDLVHDIGGGIPGGKQYKAAQLGGPSGGCIPREYLNTPLDYESLQELGAIMGSGGVVVMDEDNCMVDVARFFLEFVQEESCGKCVPCRVGTKRMLEIVTRICNGEGEEGDIEKLEELGKQIRDTSLCGLGQTAPNPVLSTIRHFRSEYEEHIRQKKCTPGICPSLVDSPCRSACPANVDIPGYLALVSEGRIAEALRLHRERNPLAAVCARVCFHSCETKCRHTLVDGESVAIRGVKRFMADQEVTVQLPDVRENPENAKKKVAIIGAGPAGLSCGYFLARMGYKPQIFEAEERPGGMLVQAIPAYRLPREILAREVRMIENMGVEILTGKKLGRDFTLEGLKEQGYEAVFLAVGAPLGSKMGIPGEDAEGVVDAMEFNKVYNMRGSVPVGRKVIIIGGGNSAVDAARTALRLGAESVTIVYRRSREDMPAYDEEIEEATHEGVELMMLTLPEAVLTENGKVCGVRCRHMSLAGFDRSGRRRPEAAGDSFVLPADQVISAIGQALDLDALVGEVGVKKQNKQFIEVNPVTGQTSVDWIFGGGDAVTGPDSVVGAVAAGERAAVGIDHMLTGANHAFWRTDAPVPVAFDPEEPPVPYAREKMPTIPVERRKNSFEEVEHCWEAPVAMRQAKRCLRCEFGKRV